ncbi:MAG: exodeoxyribonuclease VII small subunit [Deltaproteobacteria bacterium]|nr:exodeoxyribonuclease VII small subunit [Deltaproteobacteria bacterium]
MNSDKPKSTDEDKSFDAVLGELQHTVEELECSDLPLERSLAAFERGVELSRYAQNILDRAERKVEILLRDGSKEPFTGEE